MYITHLRLVNFRNHRRTELMPAPGISLFVGANAQGKTSLLEAVQVVSTGRSRRAQREVEMVCFGEDWARVHVRTQRADRAEELDVAFRQDVPVPEDRLWKELRVNGVPVQRAEALGHLLCVAATPTDGDTLAASAPYRRHTLDSLLAQMSPAYYYTVQRYARVVLQRNRLLRERRGEALDPWDEQVAGLGAAITVRRRELVARLASAAGEFYRELSEGRETLTVTYVPMLAGSEETEIAAAGREALRKSRAGEVARGMTLVGPHRDDVRLEVDGRLLRVFGSRGQQMAAMLALRLAERVVLRETTGEEPVLLLDDVLMALDPARQAELLAAIRGAQAFITLMMPVALPGLAVDTAVFRVVNGSVAQDHAHLA